MKHKLLIIGVIVLSIALTAGVMDPDGKAGYTGSPDETTCNTTQCHNSFVLNSGDGSITATSTMYNWTYEPFVTYTINIKVAKPAVHLFGFGVEILTSTNANAGTIVVTDAARTRIKQRIVNGVIRRNITHQENGGAFQDSSTFTFDWTAPDTTVGSVTLYFAGNAANSNGQPTGDYIYNDSQLIVPSGGNAVRDFATADPFGFYPNPAHSKISMHYFLPGNEIVIVKLYDLKNSSSYILLNAKHSAGENNEVISIADYPAGLYLLSFESGSTRIIRKIMID